MEWITKTIEVLKLPTKFIFVIFLSSILLLFLPKEILSQIKVENLNENYGFYIGLSAIITGILLIIETIVVIWNFLVSKFYKIKFMSTINERLNNLDSSEKAVLREFYLQGKNTIKLPMDNPTVAGLRTSGLLQLVGGQGNMSMAGMLFPTKISDLVRNKITLENIELPSGEPSQQEIDFLKKNRPNFIATIAREESIFNY